jgi:hypothetical protein
MNTLRQAVIRITSSRRLASSLMWVTPIYIVRSTIQTDQTGLEIDRHLVADCCGDVFRSARVSISDW